MIPFNLCYLAAYARQKHPDVEFRIFDAGIKWFSHQDTAKEFVCFPPDFIGITATNICVFGSVIALTNLSKLSLPRAPKILYES